MTDVGEYRVIFHWIVSKIDFLLYWMVMWVNTESDTYERSITSHKIIYSTKSGKISSEKMHQKQAKNTDHVLGPSETVPTPNGFISFQTKKIHRNRMKCRLTLWAVTPVIRFPPGLVWQWRIPFIWAIYELYLKKAFWNMIRSVGAHL